ncbi:MAG: hypothetical protein ACXV77_13990 [Acidimicrobiia bacterium]
MTAVASALAALAMVVPPPPSPGPWLQLGPVATSRAGKQVHFFRTAQSPKALGVVVTSNSSQPIRLFWWSYCEFESDDSTFQESQDTVTGRHMVVAYPPVFDGATLCYVSVNAGTSRGHTVSAAVFRS